MVKVVAPPETLPPPYDAWQLSWAQLGSAPVEKDPAVASRWATTPARAHPTFSGGWMCNKIRPGGGLGYVVAWNRKASKAQRHRFTLPFRASVDE